MRFEIGARDGPPRIGPRIRPRMGRRARPGADVSTHRTVINTPLFRLIGIWGRPYTCCRRAAGCQITRVAGDRQRCGRARVQISRGERSIRDRSGLIGAADGNYSDIGVHAGGP